MTVAGETPSVSGAVATTQLLFAVVTMPCGTGEFMGSWHLVQLDVDLGSSPEVEVISSWLNFSEPQFPPVES